MHGDPSSLATDMYAFACVCYEVCGYSNGFLYPAAAPNSLFSKIFSGNVPFHELFHDGAVLFKVLGGIRPSRPTEASTTHLDDDIWQLIETCWSSEPNNRPRAFVVVEFLLPRLTQPRPVQTWDESFVSRLRTNLLEHPFIPHTDILQQSPSRVPQQTYNNLASGKDFTMESFPHNDDQSVQANGITVDRTAKRKASSHPMDIMSSEKRRKRHQDPDLNIPTECTPPRLGFNFHLPLAI